MPLLLLNICQYNIISNFVFLQLYSCKNVHTTLKKWLLHVQNVNKMQEKKNI